MQTQQLTIVQQAIGLLAAHESLKLSRAEVIQTSLIKQR